jgi:hypothetical protein
MNYEVIDSPRRIAAQDASDQHAAQAELAMHDDFIAACKAGDVYAPCQWAPKGIERDGKGCWTHSKTQTLDEVMNGSLDYTGGPSTTDVMALLCSVAYGTEDNRKRAQALISRMASTFAKYNAEEA